MPTPGEFTLTGSVTQIIADGVDIGTEEDLAALAGTVITFTSNIPINKAVPFGGGVFYIPPRTAIVLADGQLSEDGVNPGITLLANDPALELTAPLQWTISPGRATLAGKPVKLAKWTFNASDPGVDITLEEATPVPGVGQPGGTRGPRGFRGAPVDDVELVSSSGELSLTLSTAGDDVTATLTTTGVDTIQFSGEGNPIGDPLPILVGTGWDSIVGKPPGVYMPAPSGDTTGVTDTANLVAAQEKLLAGIAGSIIHGFGTYWYLKDRIITSYQHWYGQGPGATVLKLAAGQDGNLLATKNFGTWMATDGSTAVSATKTVDVTSGSEVVTTSSSTGVSVGDLVNCAGFHLGAWVTAVTSTTITLSEAALSTGTGRTAQFSSIPTGWGLHDLTLDGYGRFTGQNDGNRIDPPAAPTVTVTGTPGSTIYSYRVTAVNAVGETQMSPPTKITTGNATLTGSNYNAVSWSAVTGATSYNVYKAKASRFWPQATLDIAPADEVFLVNTASTSYHDTGAASTGAWGPVQNTTPGRVLGTYGWGYTIENVDIAGGAGLGWEAGSVANAAVITFATARNFQAFLSNVHIRDNRYGGAKLGNPTDGTCVNVDFSHNGNATDATTNWLANLDMQTSGWSWTNYHIYGGGCQIGVRIVGTSNMFINGQNEEGYLNWLILNGANIIDGGMAYTTSGNDDVAAFYVNSYGNRISSQVRETGAGILQLGPGSGYNIFDLDCLFTSNNVPSPPYTGYLDPQSRMTLRVVDVSQTMVVLLDQASRNISAGTSTSYTLGLADSGTVTLSNGSPITLTVPTNATAQFPIGHSVDLIQLGAGQVTVAGAGGVTVTGTPGLKLRAQNATGTLTKLDTNTWVLGGDLSA